MCRRRTCGVWRIGAWRFSTHRHAQLDTSSNLNSDDCAEPHTYQRPDVGAHGHVRARLTHRDAQLDTPADGNAHDCGEPYAHQLSGIGAHGNGHVRA